MPDQRCAVCGADDRIEFRVGRSVVSGFTVGHAPGDDQRRAELERMTITPICSPSCLVEWAWKLKETQEKLSKSK